LGVSFGREEILVWQSSTTSFFFYFVKEVFYNSISKRKCDFRFDSSSCSSYCTAIAFGVISSICNLNR